MSDIATAVQRIEVITPLTEVEAAAIAFVEADVASRKAKANLRKHWREIGGCLRAVGHPENEYGDPSGGFMDSEDEWCQNDGLRPCYAALKDNLHVWCPPCNRRQWYWLAVQATTRARVGALLRLRSLVQKIEAAV